MKRLTLQLIIILFACAASAQIETTLPAMRNMFQSSFVNPAFMPEYNVQVGLPILNSTAFNLGIHGISARAAVQSLTEDNYIDIDQMVQNMSGNKIGSRLSLNKDLFYVSFPVKDFVFSFGAATTSMFDLGIRKEILTADFFVPGKTLDLSGTGFQMIAYSNIHFGVGTKIKDKFTIGGRIKLLRGHAYAALDKFVLKTTAGADIPYPVRLQASGRLQTSGLPAISENVGGETATDQDKEFDAANLINPRNGGFAIDLGVTYTPIENVLTYMSISDIGFIRWTNQSYRYNLNSVDVSFDGFTYAMLNSPSQRQEYLESLNVVDNLEANRRKFTQMMPARFMIGGEYQFLEKNRTGLMVQMQTLAHTTVIAYSLSYSCNMSKNWFLTTNYTLIDHNRSVVGLGNTVMLGPMQLFYVQDDILALFDLARARTVSFRLGINWVFGKK
jgi:hypothetical protein